MGTPIEGGFAVVSLPNGDSSKFVIRIATPNQLFVSPEDDKNNISSILYHPSDGIWMVEGTDINYNITFEMPEQIIYDANDADIDHVFYDDIRRGNFDKVDRDFDTRKRNFFQNIVLSRGNLRDLYKLRRTIDREELFRTLNWYLKHNIVYGGHLLMEYLLPMERASAYGATLHDNDKPHPLVYDVITWILDNDISVIFDPLDPNGEDLRTDLRRYVIHVLRKDDANLFRELYKIPYLFEFISEYDDPNLTMIWINEKIDEYDANNIRMSYQTPVKSARKR